MWWQQNNDTYTKVDIDSFRFINFSLSDLVDNLSGRIFNSIVCTLINAYYSMHIILWICNSIVCKLIRNAVLKG